MSYPYERVRVGPITDVEVKRGVEFVMANWERADQEWLLSLPPNEAEVVGMLAGELGAMPYEEPELPSRVMWKEPKEDDMMVTQSPREPEPPQAPAPPPDEQLDLFP